ncbi:MAG: hypothetical protein LUD41_00835, partial [Phascolarctobacterium sp.]|nr:hypothetical protein [Phascolarctobacterium sp.]
MKDIRKNPIAGTGKPET